VPQTPDRHPGPLEEDEEIQLREPADNSPPSVAGAFRYVGGDFAFRDQYGTFNPRTGGSGITEGQHEALDTLVHDIDETSYEEYAYSGSKVTNLTVWATAAKLLKIREEQYTYAGSKVSQVVTIQYDGTGAVKMTMTENYTYSGGKVTSVTRTKA
jgi:hypothetical protein